MKPKVPFIALTGLLVLVALFLAGSVQADTAIFVNELHYDNAGADTGEGVEIAGPAGTDLSGWSVVFYNGSNGTVYATLNLSGAIPDQQSGFGTLNFPQTGIQNGSPDGFALVDDGGAVVQFLSYEGAFVAVGGPADGMFSTDIGVSQSSSNPVGNSLQLTGTGTTYDTFNWAPSMLETFGAVNTAQSFSGGPSGPQIVINEIMQNPAKVSDANGEWFELYNAGSSDVDIEGWTIRDDGSDSHVIANGGPLVVPATGYIVLGNNADSGTNGGANVAYSYGSRWFLSNGADEVILEDGGGAEVDRVEYDGGPNFPDPTGASMSLLDPTFDNNVGANWCTSTTPFGAGDKGTPGFLNNCDALPQEAFIHEVQGSGGTVAITDLVIVEAIVVGDFQNGDQLRGFFIQEEDEDADSDPNTSEGILAFCGGCTTDVAVGDKVQVTGWPGEYFGMSQIDAAGSDGLVTVGSNDNTLPTASAVDLPAAGSTVSELTLEYVEGMLVTFPDTLVVSEYFQLARFGQLVLTVDERPRQFTDANEPDVAGYAAFLDGLSSRRIILDDDNNLNNSALGSPDEPYYWPREGLSNSNLIRGGDSIQNLTGVLHWSWAGGSNTDAWRVRPVLEAVDYDFTPVIPRPVTPVDVGGSLKVASFNVLNYFSTIDVGPDICGPDEDLDCRGAHSVAELTRQRDKIVSAMITMDADVIGLMELENNASAAIQDLVDGLNAVAGDGAYDFIDTGTIGSDAIKVGLIYKTATAEPVGDFAILDTSVDPTFNDDKNRPVLAQTFVQISDGAKLTIAVNHLKSKGSPCDDVGDPGLNDGQANCNLTRTSAATALANWLATDPTGSGDLDFLITGDLNSYRMEDPIDALKAGGYTDLLDALIGPDAYTYLFDGQLGYLDYAMANGNLLGQVTGVTPWNINADEIPVFDYNDEIQDPGEAPFERESSSLPIFENNAYRASDHDPVLVGLDLNGPPVCSTAMPNPKELWPANHKFVPVSVDGVTDPDGDPVTITIDAIWQDEPVNGTGDGDSSPDGEGVGTDTAWLRAERDGGGNGRAYHVYFTADDGQNNSCSGEVIVYAPLNKGEYGEAVDDGALYDSTIP